MVGTDDAVSLVELLDERRHLLDVAMCVLSSGREAEQVIDEAYRQWFGLPQAQRARIVDPRSWLARAVGGICLSRPSPGGERARVPQSEPRYAEPADRARRSLRAREGQPTSVAEHDAVVGAVRAACVSGDVEVLTSLLAGDATAVFDGGGKVRALVGPVHGGAPVARSLLTLLARHPRTTLETHPVNGRTGLVVRYERLVAAVVVLDVAGPQVVQVWVTLNPDKLRTWNHAAGLL
ncbi:RNA polymerase subunit sigma [Streptomyces sp. NPDC093568]|uniref:RNA polymerase subunit sigma n=1 Tax=Streptomyces sp. NPDC093568 TaxID=3366041 RepID=UPI003806BF73